jgi:cellulose biosynthesis protein BcsQ
VQATLNPNLRILGVLVTFYDSRLSHHHRSLEIFKALDLPLLPVIIGRSIRVAEAMAEGGGVISYKETHQQAENYRQLGKIIERQLFGSIEQA